jgi:hypothetical protein
MVKAEHMEQHVTLFALPNLLMAERTLFQGAQS